MSQTKGVVWQLRTSDTYGCPLILHSNNLNMMLQMIHMLFVFFAKMDGNQRNKVQELQLFIGEHILQPGSVNFTA